LPVLTFDRQTILVLKGLLEGFGAPVEDNCVKASVRFGSDIDKAMAKMSAKTPAGYIEAMKMMHDAVQKALPKAAKSCKATATRVEQIESASAQFNDPMSFAVHVGGDVFVNMENIREDFEAAQTAWKANESESFGKHIGRAMDLALLGSEKLVSETTKTTVETAKPLSVESGEPMSAKDLPSGADSVDLLKGFMEGLGAKVDAGCIKNADPFKKDIDNAVALLNKPNPTQQDMAQAFELMSDAIKVELPKCAMNCKSAQPRLLEIYSELEKYDTKIELGLHLAKNIAMNYSEVSADVTAGVAGVTGAQYEKGGEGLGAAMSVALMGKETVSFKSVKKAVTVQLERVMSRGLAMLRGSASLVKKVAA
jgi:hypothetical protein